MMSFEQLHTIVKCSTVRVLCAVTISLREMCIWCSEKLRRKCYCDVVLVHHDDCVCATTTVA
jgi:hypothetical protein